MEVILASASPRRKKYLSLLYDDYKIIRPDIREMVPHNLPVEQCPAYLAEQKAKSVAAGYKRSLVIGFDTSVICEGKILNKPRSTKDAYQMMTMLSGKKHTVITGCCLCYMEKNEVFSESTEVEFYELSEQEINQYIATSEPYDKAGGYGIQSTGALFVKGIVGDYYNVVGLPLARLKREVDKFLDQDFTLETPPVVVKDKPKSKF